MENIKQMQAKKNQQNSTIIFALIGSFLISLILFIEIKNNRFWLNDFKVMYSAAAAFLNNEPIYGVPFGLSTGYYKYSPFTMLFFIPFIIIPYKAASIIQFLIIGFCAISNVILLEKIIRKYFSPTRKKHYLTLFVVFICVLNHLVRDLHLGNINMILIYLLTLSIYFNLNNKPIIGGALLAFTIMAKPYFLICVLPLLVHKKFKSVTSNIVWIILFITISLFIFGPSKGSILYQNWFSAMLAHNNYLSSHDTIFALINSYFGILIPSKYGIYLLAIIAVISSLSIFIIHQLKEKKHERSAANNNKSLIIHYFLIIAIIPNILITDTEHFIFSMPLIAILLFHLKRKSFVLIVLFILLIFMYGGNSTDLLGKFISNKVSIWGILGISNLIIIGTTVYLFTSNKRIKKH